MKYLRRLLVGVALDLQIYEPDRVPGPAGSLRHELEAQRFEPQEHIRVKQRAGMDEKNFHRDLRTTEGVRDQLSNGWQAKHCTDLRESRRARMHGPVMP